LAISLAKFNDYIRLRELFGLMKLGCLGSLVPMPLRKSFINCNCLRKLSLKLFNLLHIFVIYI
jgi:hypothetical protein